MGRIGWTRLQKREEEEHHHQQQTRQERFFVKGKGYAQKSTTYLQ